METNYWRVSAGKGGKYWEEFLQEEKIKIGWKKLSDASHILTLQECREYLKLQGETQAKYFFDFLKEMKHGDIVFVSKGCYDILGIAKIVSDYAYDDRETSEYKHFRKIKWLSIHIITNILNHFQSSLKQIKDDELTKILANEQIRFILEAHKSIASEFDLFTDSIPETYEGYQKERFINHILRERDKTFIKRFKEKHKSIQICPACNFNPELTYGIKAIDLFEAHHTIPIGSRDKNTGSITSEEDLILLCPNCHKFIHKIMLEFPSELISLDILKKKMKF